jgi:hypothetical protein
VVQRGDVTPRPVTRQPPSGKTREDVRRLLEAG